VAVFYWQKFVRLTIPESDAATLLVNFSDRSRHMNAIIASSLLAFSLAASPSFANQTVQPTKTVTTAVKPNPATSVAAKSSRLNINTANAQQMAQSLNGVGLKKAEAIVAYRKANGPFKSVAELVEVKGIGPAIVERNLDKMAVR
jgi:competence protein ComEA